MDLSEVLRTLGSIDPDKRAAIAEKAIEATKDRKFIPSPGPQTEAYFSDADILLYGGQAGGGKQLKVDTEVKTHNRGWQKMGSLVVGDQVFGSDGKPCNVVAVTEPEVPSVCYRVVFNTGEEIEADANHQWLTLTALERNQILHRSKHHRDRRRANRPSRAVKNPMRPNQSIAAKKANAARLHQYKEPPRPTVRTTQEIHDTLRYGKKRNHSVEVAAPLDQGEARLPCDPYLLGLWLGDGHSNDPIIGMDNADWAKVDHPVPMSEYKRVEQGRRPFTTKRFAELWPVLRECGVRGDKRIPEVYQNASFEQRLALLQGLMDTDGTVARSSGACEIGLSKRDLVEDVQELLSGLGIKTTITTKPLSQSNPNHADSHKIKFYTPHAAFRLKRKLKLQNRAPKDEYVLRRYIVAVEPIAPTLMRCIQVDSPDNSYIVGRTFIVTHNSALLCGLALEEHRNSLLMRRKYNDLQGGGGLIDELLKMNGSRDGFNGSPPPTLRVPGTERIITFGGANHPGDEQSFQGRARDFLGLDEAAQFLRSQVEFLMGWVRSSVEGQRTRTVLATNPPVTADGDWIVSMFRPWLDLTHPKPAKHGELRWFVTDPDGKDMEVDGPEPVTLDGRDYTPLSRTFIPAALSDNPFLRNTDYGARMDALPEPLRSAMRDGNFMLARQDSDWQVIPTQWVREAQARWTPEPPEHAPMTAIGVDVAQGGPDQTVLAARYDGWFAPLEAFPGTETPTGPDIAGLVFTRRKNNAAIVIDMGGGYGGSAYDHLIANGVTVSKHVGANASVKRTADQSLGFHNKRSEVWWRFREALDPGQQGGSPIALPDDPELVADLTAPTYDASTGNIKVEPKVKLVERIGRSPDRGDAVTMAWSAGPRLVTHGNQWRKFKDESDRGHKVNVVMNKPKR